MATITKKQKQKNEGLEAQGQNKQTTNRKKKGEQAKAFSISWLKEFPGLEGLSDQEAKEALDFLEAFAQLTFNQYTSIYGQP